MLISPFQVFGIGKLHNRITSLKPAELLDKETSEPRDVVEISSTGKKKQVLAQTRSDVLEKVREAGKNGQEGL